ncbi:MAG: hypothetical protein CMM50_03630 [Rhodospirillaceae bacterium]|nr:hypothetical protein [Rhodospirillaceae bacterium]
MSRASSWRVGVGYAVSVLCIVGLSFQVDFRDVWRELGTVDVPAVMGAMALTAGCYVCFGLRWRLLLDCAGRLSNFQTFAYLVYGLMLNAVLPLRSGDVLRAFLAGRACRGGTMGAVASIVVERMADVMTMLAVALGLWAFGDIPALVRQPLAYVAVVVFLGALVLVAVARYGNDALDALHGGEAPGRRRLWSAVVTRLHIFTRALVLVNANGRLDLRRYAGTIALGLLGWTSFAAATIAVVSAFDIAAPVSVGLLLVVVTNLGAAVPSSPGAIGVYHAIGTAVLSAIGLDRDLALSVTTVSHAVTVLVQVGLGSAALAILPVADRRGTAAANDISQEGSLPST